MKKIPYALSRRPSLYRELWKRSLNVFESFAFEKALALLSLGSSDSLLIFIGAFSISSHSSHILAVSK